MYWPERNARSAASWTSGLTKHLESGIVLVTGRVAFIVTTGYSGAASRVKREMAAARDSRRVLRFGERHGTRAANARSRTAGRYAAGRRAGDRARPAAHRSPPDRHLARGPLRPHRRRHAFSSGLLRRAPPRTAIPEQAAAPPVEHRRLLLVGRARDRMGGAAAERARDGRDRPRDVSTRQQPLSPSGGAVGGTRAAHELRRVRPQPDDPARHSDGGLRRARRVLVLARGDGSREPAGADRLLRDAGPGRVHQGPRRPVAARRRCGVALDRGRSAGASKTLEPLRYGVVHRAQPG